MKKNRSLIVLFTLLVQCLAVITINHSILSAQELSTLKALLPWVNLIVVVILILTVLSIKQLEKDIEPTV
jgi:cobalamin biosynthesis protein CobD/CbiB